MGRIIRLVSTSFPLVFVALVIAAAVSGCGNVASNLYNINMASPFSSFRDIPGITPEEIVAIEALRGQYDHFVYGMNHTIEAFPVSSEQDSESGEYAVGGYAARICEWLSSLFDIPFRPVIYDWNDLISGLENGEVDFTGDLIATEEFKQSYFMTSTIAERSMKSYRIEGSPSIAEISNSRSPRLAVPYDFAPFDYAREIVEYEFETVFITDHDEAYRMLESGEADAFLSMDIAEPALNVHGNMVSETFYPLVFALASLSTRNPDLKPVISVVQKALENGAAPYLAALYSQGRRDYIKNKFFESLDPEELEYIQHNNIVKVATESDSYPLSFFNYNDNELQGIAFDVMSELNMITGLSFQIASSLNASFLDLTDMVESGQASMITAMMRSRERERHFLLPEISIMTEFPILFSKSEFPNVKFNELSNVTVGIVRGTLHAELFKRWFPNNRSFREYDNLDGAFNALVRGEVDMFMAMSNYLLSLENYKELVGYKANVVFDNNFDITFGFNKDEVVMYSIIGKAMRLVDMEAISRYWTRKTYDYRAKIAEARLPWLIGATALALIALALIVILVLRNLNLRKLNEAETKTRETDEKIKTMFDAMPLCANYWTRDGEIADCNEEVLRLFDLTDKSEFIGHFRELSPKYQPDGTLSARRMPLLITRAYEQGHCCFEWMMQKLNGEPISVEITLVRIKHKDEYILASYMRDLTEQKAKEQLTKEVMEKSSTLTAILDTAPDLIFVKDLDSRYTLCNKSFEKLMGCSIDDIIGKDDAEGLKAPPEVAEAFAAEDKKIFDNKQGVMFEDYILASDGSRILFETLKAPLFIGGKMAGLVGIARDITQRKEMARQQAEAEAANRAKSSFLASMSHEMRTPMNAIMGVAEIQLQNGNLSTETKTALDIIYSSGYTLMGIINDLLDLSKIEAGKLELVKARYETASLINDTINLNTARIGSKPIEFKLHVDEELPFELIGDELRVKQIMNNLLSNSFKYTEKGEVSLSFSSQITGNEKSSADDKNAPDVKLTITVRDTGQGMTEDQVQGMFDAYSRFNMKANRFVEGTGLGMNIVQQLVKQMDGFICVESEPGKGTEIIVQLTQGYAGPARLGKELAENLKGFRLAGMSKMKKAQIVREPMPYGSVLVVDDMETNLYVAKGFLLPYGLKIATAISGMEAIEKINRGNVYDIVFMDHMMPVMDGIEAVKAIRGNGYKRPIVALTANAVAGQADIFMANGFDGFISKPIDIRELNASLNKFVRDRAPPEVVEAARAGSAGASADTGPQLDTELVKIFTRDAEKASAVLQEYEARNAYGSDDLQMYTINVHALKSALANIGEMKLSGMAKELEQGGREKNIAYISGKTAEFLKELGVLVDKLKAGAEEQGVDEVSEEDMEYLRKMLQTVKESCSTYDIKAAKAALTELKQKPWPHSYNKLLDTIAGHLLHSDFDEAVAVCADCLSMDNSKFGMDK